MSINAPVKNIFGAGMPGNAGISVSQEGASNSAMDVTSQLKEKAIAFVNTYRNPSETASTILQLSEQVEGELMNEQLLEILTAKESEELIADLHELVNARQKISSNLR